jgi:hypothetical protein
MCFIQGGCKFTTIKEEWLKPKDTSDFTSLLRFDECCYCHDVRATIVHPEDFNSRWSKPSRSFHRSATTKDSKESYV